ncbi:Interferon-induced, double-stranded RNA-activated protein kinase [Anabarilius grahami]|uniref:Interferon-induced, double-stranded RNA-activated protein kinase n=1 Tax=Anabarilius grahami TaxID=495550 RepID=A0A3N0XYJ2_ANAGA|nr:Interferon-induced, double-stranded RNA-activated protein kinase [Anabarilius grahami]
MSAESEMERKIVNFLRQNGKSTALTIAKGIGLDKSTVNRHLYSLERSKQVFRSNEKRPVWDLMEKTNGIKQTVTTPEKRSLTPTAETCEEKHVKDLLRSGGLKACHIATALGQPTKTVKKQLYSMMETGKVKKCEISSLWILEGEEGNESHNQESDHTLGSVAGLSQSFDVITKLGEGGFGCVYKVKHKFDGKIYAVKKVELTGSRTYLFIQMEFCEGGTLTEWIRATNRTNKQRTTVEIHKIFYEIVSGVEYIHSNKLIHRDLKPDNILFGTDGKVKIGDFGLVAAQTNHSGGPIERSKRRGTLQYMSPEQENKRNYDEKTDIFPLGLIWFEMLWKLSTGMERAENKFIKKMLSCTPEDRPDAKDIKEKLEKFFSLDQNLLSQKTV